MVRRIVILLLISFVFRIVALDAQSPAELTDIFDKGQQAVEDEGYKQALELWREAPTRSAGGLTDPRIGISFIKVAIQQELKSYYEEAVDLYYWGLSNPSDKRFKQELENEIERMQPILSYSKFREWRRLLRDDKLESIGKEIINFWEWEDPTIDTRYNERLIEHWQRIHHSQKNFTRGQSTIYGTDDRALAYVKYGSPDVIRDGILSYNSGMLRTWLREAFGMGIPRILSRPSGPNTDSVANTSSTEMRNAMAVDMIRLDLYEKTVRLQHLYPSYEIWVYKDIDNNNYHNLIYIFGTDGNSGEFGMRKSIEELMPNGSFSSNRSGMRVAPSYFLQLMYYEDLITVDPYFAESYRDMESRLYSFQGSRQLDSRQMRSRNRSRLVQAQMGAPEQRSTLSEGFAEIPVEVYQYRLLNENNEPYLVTFLQSNPYRAYFFDQAREQNFNPSYKLSGSAMALDQENSIMFKKKSSAINLRGLQGFSGNIDNIAPELLYLEVPYDERMENQKFTIELLNESKDSTQIVEGVFRENLRALGSISLDGKPEPIATDTSQLQMGDLILGVPDQLTTVADGPFGFSVKPDARIVQGENLVVHFEIYHLQEMQESVNPIQLNYVVTKKQGFFKRLFSKSEKVSLSLNYEVRESHFRQNLEIDTSPFDTGDYTLELTAVEPATDREVSRSIEFVIEGENSD